MNLCGSNRHHPTGAKGGVPNTSVLRGLDRPRSFTEGFWTAYVSRPVYGGWLVDKINGVPDFKWNLFGLKFKTDANVSLFTPAVIVLVAAAIMLVRIVSR